MAGEGVGGRGLRGCEVGVRDGEWGVGLCFCIDILELASDGFFCWWTGAGEGAGGSQCSHAYISPLTIVPPSIYLGTRQVPVLG
jgi:hypothetical protein